MRKRFFCIISLLMVLMGYASDGRVAAETIGNSPGMDLDAAIREVVGQMEAKIPSGTTVALVSVASPSTAFSTLVLIRFESAIVSSGKLVVVDRANLDKVREEQGVQLSGKVDDESATSIGKLLGVGAIVTGSLADLGDVYSLTLKAINIETATVAASYLVDLAKSTRIESLLASVGTPAAPPSPAVPVRAPTPSASAAPPTPVSTPTPAVPVRAPTPSAPAAPPTPVSAPTPATPSTSAVPPEGFEWIWQYYFGPQEETGVGEHGGF